MPLTVDPPGRTPRSLVSVSVLRAIAIPLSVGLTLLNRPDAAAGQSFRDTSDHWGGDCISQLAAENALNGYPDGSFRPNHPVTRAEFAVLMLNSFPDVRPRYQDEPEFRDLSTDHWAYSSIQTAYRKGIFVGYPDQTFRADQSITRIEALAILSTLIRRPDHQRYRERGLAIPPNPQQVLAEMVQDAQETPDWAQEAAAAAAASFLIVDYPNGRHLRPQAASTRAEIAAFLCQSRDWHGLVPLAAVAGNQHFSGHPGLAIVQEATIRGQAAWFDRQRERVVRPVPPAGWQVQELGDLAEDRVAALFEDESGTRRWGYFDHEGQLAIAPEFSSAAEFSEGLAAISQQDQYGFIDATGQLVIPAQFEAVQPFHDGRAAVRVQGQWGFIDRSGEEVIAPQFVAVSPFSEGLARIEARPSGKSHYGFIDRSGQAVIAAGFKEARSFSEGLAAVCVEIPETGRERCGYINPQGDWVIEGTLGIGGDFSSGVAAIRRLERGSHVEFGYSDRNGDWEITSESLTQELGGVARDLGTFVDGFASLRVGENAGVIDRQGRLVVPLKFSAIGEMAQGYARVHYGGVWVSYVGGYDHSAMPFYETNLESGRWGYIKLPD
ncbi:MAG: WG repeat-containing protein [Cyanobacteriota bacterium]